MDYSLYLVTDRCLSKGRSSETIVRAAIRGGVSCVQLREKTCSTRDFLKEAYLLKTVLEPHKIPLIINDRIDIALAVRAEGVHLGQSDMPLWDARKIVGDDMIVGISAESVEDAVVAEQQGADYIGISPVFATATKDDIAPPLGLEGVRQIREAVSLPLVGIGGINANNGHLVFQAGADGIAVVSAIVSADCPESATAELKKTIQRG
ncbi:thiamine phosphate synthase [Desulfogranum marinum]|jgi:thiamine-phosphate pyrophosphorylase|uniref:thiamine phosphate synthase n=1 Tax=Desulfogranum marinum TaxID=453220 RepID=UPI001965EBA8|nr:thiamine phosphate synthase [Desulfogranum marinum]MBM9514147.1 thiamine phosphate synthase [Desulfogranum marinum]